MHVSSQRETERGSQQPPERAAEKPETSMEWAVQTFEQGTLEEGRLRKNHDEWEAPTMSGIGDVWYGRGDVRERPRLCGGSSSWAESACSHGGSGPHERGSPRYKYYLASYL